MFRDFIRQAVQEWGKMERYEASKGGELPHAMTSGESSKPYGGAYKRITSYQCEPMGQAVRGSGGKRSHSGPMAGPRRDGDGTTGRTAGQRAHGHPPYGWSVHPSLWSGGITTRIPDLKFYLTKQF